MASEQKSLDGLFDERDLPLLIRRAGMSDWCGDSVRILDRRQLPEQEVFLQCVTPEQVADAIQSMAIQGAFSIAIAAGYGLALTDPKTTETFESNAARLRATRPTGLALNRMMDACIQAARTAQLEGKELTPAVLQVVDQAAHALALQGWKTGSRAADLLPHGCRVLTHCFPDRSFAYMLVEMAKRGKSINLYCSETRPYLQGARLAALCGRQMGFDTKVITDGMGGLLMRRGDVTHFITAADRVCMDGTVCNKVGTYQYALAAKANDVPYYTLRQSGPDLESATEADVSIEERNGDEILYWQGRRLAPEGVSGVYPAFDITPPQLVSAIITDRGVFSANMIHQYPDTESFTKDAIL